MYRKVTTWRNEAGEKTRIYYKDSVCQTPENLEKVLAGGWSDFTVRTSGVFYPVKLRFASKKQNPNLPEFLGLQNPPKAVKEVVKDAEGKVVPPKRGKKSAVTPAVIKQMVEAADKGMTLKEAALALKIPYASLYVASIREKISFKKGKKGRKAKPDLTLIQA